MMRILGLIPSEPGYSPGQRSSVEIWQRPLECAGFCVVLAPFEDRYLREALGRKGRNLQKSVGMVSAYRRRVKLLRDVSTWDAVLVYREAALIGPAVLERWLARRGVPIIYVLDDPLYIPYVSPANGLLSYLKCFGKVATICGLSRVVIANSRAHREFAQKYCANVYEIPSLVDGTAYRYTHRYRGSGPVCVGWSGSSTTAANLSLIAEALAAVGRRSRFRFHAIGADPLEIPGISSTAQPWRADTEIEDLSQFDIGVVPLPDNPWNRRKFNLKIAQYMSLGIVPVATPLGSNPEVITAGVDGFLAGDKEEWVSSLERLIQDSALRTSMAEHAARKASERFTIQAQQGRVVEAFSSAVT